MSHNLDPLIATDPRWQRGRDGVWHHPEHGAWYYANDGRWYQAHPHMAPAPQHVRTANGSGCGTIIFIAVALSVLVGGCAFIVTDPVVALAIFFVGIPFASLVIWAIFAALSPPRR